MQKNDYEITQNLQVPIHITEYTNASIKCIISEIIPEAWKRGSYSRASHRTQNKPCQPTNTTNI